MSDMSIISMPGIAFMSFDIMSIIIESISPLLRESVTSRVTADALRLRPW